MPAHDQGEDSGVHVSRTRSSAWEGNIVPARTLGFAASALCAVAILHLAMAAQPVQLGELVSLSGNTTNSTANADQVPAGEGEQGLHGCAIPSMPHSFHLTEDFWAFVHTVRISSDDHNHDTLGSVQSKPFSATSEQTWYDSKGRKVATSHRDVFSFVATIYVRDCHDESLAVVDEQLVASPSSSITLITVKDEFGLELARSQSDEQFENQLEVLDNRSGKQVATIRQRPGSTDFWDVTLVSDAEGAMAIDPRIIIMSVAAESAAVAFGLGALPFLVLLVAFFVVVAILCFNMMRKSDPDDPRYGIFAMFDGADADRARYSEIGEPQVVRV